LNALSRFQLVTHAMAFAVAAHAAVGQRRKYTGEAYIEHPTRVVVILTEAGINDPETLAAAWLHDVVEDTDVSIFEIQTLFGSDVAQLVSEVTNVSTRADGNRARRMELERQHLADASPRGQTIKVADLIDNTSDITKHDPEFARVYLREKQAILEVLTEAHPVLLERARQGVEEYLSTQEAA
jgi:(p)ppGpp synthase/HD superfamily hydrolase